MPGEWKQSISAPPSTVAIGDITRYTDHHESARSPIDHFYSQRQLILSLCTPEWINLNPSIAPLMIVGLISSVENYYRDLLASLIRICPISKKNASNRSIGISSIYFGYNDLERGVFENISLSDAKSIRKLLKEISGIDTTKNNNQIEPPLQEFQKLCEIRHSIVHSDCIIASKNAIELDLASNNTHYLVRVSYNEIQESAEICTALICATNIEIFEHYVKRWAFAWRQLPYYDPSSNHQKFKEIWSLCHSKKDREIGDILEPLSMMKAKNMACREMNI